MEDFPASDAGHEDEYDDPHELHEDQPHPADESELSPELDGIDGYPDDRPNFTPESDGDGVVGDPGADVEYWHMQEHADTCAVVSQEFVLESLTHHDFSETALMHEAESNGWYTPGGGTPLEDTGRLLEAHGVPIESIHGGNLSEIRDRLFMGQKVIVGVDADEIWTPGEDPMTDDLQDPGIPGQDANHAVEVIGLVRSGSEDMVVLNDPGQPDGRGVMIPASEFQGAWDDSGDFMVAAGPGVDGAGHTAGGALRDATGPGLGYSYSTGATVDGDPVSYSVSEDRNYDGRTWATVEDA